MRDRVTEFATEHDDARRRALIERYYREDSPSHDASGGALVFHLSKLQVTSGHLLAPLLAGRTIDGVRGSSTFWWLATAGRAADAEIRSSSVARPIAPVWQAYFKLLNFLDASDGPKDRLAGVLAVIHVAPHVFIRCLVECGVAAPSSALEEPATRVTPIVVDWQGSWMDRLQQIEANIDWASQSFVGPRDSAKYK